MQADLFPSASAPAPKPYRVPCYRIALVRESSFTFERAQMRSSADVAALFRTYLGEDIDREHMLVAMIDQKNRVIGINTVSTGSLTASIVHPREVFKAPVLCNAASILLCHNHPGGDPAPSPEDRAITRKLLLAGEALSIRVTDHVILGDGTSNHYSFADNGAL